MDIIFLLGKCNFDWLRTIDNSVIEDDQRLAQLLSFLRTAVNVGVLYCIVGCSDLVLLLDFTIWWCFMNEIYLF